jgi:adenylosuccinate lyase
MAMWYAELRATSRVRARCAQVISVGKLSGAVGTFAHCRRRSKGRLPPLGWSRARASQVIQRDRHAELLSTLAIHRVIAGEVRARDSRAAENRDLGKSKSRLPKGRRAPRPCRTSAIR